MVVSLPELGDPGALPATRKDGGYIARQETLGKYVSRLSLIAIANEVAGMLGKSSFTKFA